VKAIRVSGSSVFTASELEALLADLTGGEHSLAELMEGAARITAYYRERGYVVVRAYLPPQEIRDGAVSINVLEGRLADAPLGSTISIQIPDGRSAPAPQVPIGAIFDPGNGPGVWLVEGETPRVTWRAVQIAGLSSEAASVVGNLQAGDRIVALGAHLLREGEPVRVMESERAQSVAVNGARPR